MVPLWRSRCLGRALGRSLRALRQVRPAGTGHGERGNEGGRRLGGRGRRRQGHRDASRAAWRSAPPPRGHVRAGHGKGWPGCPPAGTAVSAALPLPSGCRCRLALPGPARPDPTRPGGKGGGATAPGRAGRREGLPSTAALGVRRARLPVAVAFGALAVGSHRPALAETPLWPGCARGRNGNKPVCGLLFKFCARFSGQSPNRCKRQRGLTEPDTYLTLKLPLAI
ncbi:hypothetical protein Nmel_009062 [Mimus melanotis]